jgi:hypothetical protein
MYFVRDQTSDDLLLLNYPVEITEHTGYLLSIGVRPNSSSIEQLNSDIESFVEGVKSLSRPTTNASK